jgi:hypothetical protein
MSQSQYNALSFSGDLNLKKGLRHLCLCPFLFIIFYLLCHNLCAELQAQDTSQLYELFKSPDESSKPWVYWYWMHAAVSREGITADLEAMKEAGIGGAYLFTVKDVMQPPLYEPPAVQLSPEWYDLVHFAFAEADRLGLKMAIHSCDGFTVAGGPWITPELSMQKVVWTETIIAGDQWYDDTLPQPETVRDYYRDIAVFAFPMPDGEDISTACSVPKVTTSTGINAQFLAEKDNNEKFRSDDPCFIQYAFDRPFTCRSLKIRSNGNFQSLRLGLEISDDGTHYTSLLQLEPPRHGWQDAEADITYSLPPVTAKYYRFRYDKEGSEPGSEDLDGAKWKQSLKITGIALSGAPRIHQFEGKSGIIWRVSSGTTSEQIPDSLCVPLGEIIDISDKLNAEGRLIWNVPPGRWVILRMGHTSTGHTNYIGGAGSGLECDKLNPEAVRIQFDHWAGGIIRKIGTQPAEDVLKIFHVDSWECGSQNWSPQFRSEFLRRRGYDLLPYLPVFAGIPVQSAEVSEKFLRDVRQTIGELVADNFFGTVAELAHENGLEFSAENIAPVMTGDAMQQFDKVDIPMGEFWLNSPTHDKPNDVLDAISAAHIYGKKLIQAESFTTLRMDWHEFPGMLKSLGDRNFALGINRIAYHVYVHNPWLDRKPGMTLDGVGLYFQRDQTWWKQARAWIEYTRRCQAMLQLGQPVADIVVFTGEETPRRALTPDRLMKFLPGLFGEEKLAKEKVRLENAGVPLQEKPGGVYNTANTFRAESWIDPLRGYHYDSFNKDALINLAGVENGRLKLPGGMSYRVMVIPGSRKMSPDGKMMSAEVATRLLELVQEGATIIVSERPDHTPGLEDHPQADSLLGEIVNKLWGSIDPEKQNKDNNGPVIRKVGKGTVIQGPWYPGSLELIGIERDVICTDAGGKHAAGLAWNHRTSPDFDIYFISNQLDTCRTLNLSFRIAGFIPEFYEPVTGEIQCAKQWKIHSGRTEIPVELEPGGSVFIVFSQLTTETEKNEGVNRTVTKVIQTLEEEWKVRFDHDAGGPEDTITFKGLSDWSKHPDPSIRYFSGTAIYSKSFSWKQSGDEQQRVWLDLGRVADVAVVRVNGMPCGTAWTSPFRIEMTGMLKDGINHIEIEVTNTWANRMIGDQDLPETEKISWTTAPYRLEGAPLQPSGLLGPVQILISLGEEGKGD